MKKEYLIDKTKNENLVKRIDTHLNDKKRENNKGVKFEILKKIIPATVTFLLVIGLVSCIGDIDIDKLLSLDKVESNNVVVEDDMGLVDIPRVIEKSVFENLLANIPKEILSSGTSSSFIKKKLTAFYLLKEFYSGEYYILSSDVNGREVREILSYWNKYIDSTDMGYLKILINYYS